MQVPESVCLLPVLHTGYNYLPRPLHLQVQESQHPVHLPLDRELDPLFLPIYMAQKLLQLLLTMVPDNEDIFLHPLRQCGLVLVLLAVYEFLFKAVQVKPAIGAEIDFSMRVP